MNRWIKYLLLFFLMAVSCIDPFWPDLEGKNTVLVVDALVTDNPDNQYVILSTSAPADDQKFIPVSGAVVVVSDDLGQNVLFNESEAGSYYPDNFAGITGRSYSLSVTLPNGKQYASGFQPLTASDEFDSIYYQVETQPTTNPLYDTEVAQFYISNIPSGRQDSYYLFQFIETYKFHVDFKMEYIDSGYGLTRVTDPPSMLCFKTASLDGFYLFKSKANSVSQTQTLPLHFVTFDTKQMFERYSLLVKQISVSEEIFNLYHEINQQNNDVSLYTLQPYNIIGNITCVTDTEEPVLGSFIVGGIKEKREYFSRPPNVVFSFSSCFGQTDGVGYIVMRGGTPTNPVHFTFVDGAFAYGRPECFLCSENEATEEPPDFWED